MMKLLLSLLLVASSTLAQADTYDDLMRATKAGSAGEVAELLKRGVDVDTTDPDGHTLLMIAARDGHEALLDLLLTQRPKVNARNSVGDTPLRLAAFAGRLEIVKKLVIAGARINTPGWTPTLYAAYNGHIDVVRYLLQMGGEVNATSENGITCLMLASRNGYLDLARLLLSAKANPNKVTDQGQTAVDMANRSGNVEILKLLQAAGGKPGQP